MNKFILVLLTAFSTFAFAAEEKLICIDKIGKDGKIVMAKNDKPVQECKKMKVHKKLEGTKVPQQKK